MTARPLTMNANYLAMVRGVRELHRLSAEGRDDSPEADRIRDATDAPWEALSEVERQRARGVSEDLYSLYEAPPVLQPMNPQAGAKLGEAVAARQQGDWDRALDLLRRWKAYFDPALVSSIRGSIWLEAGDPETAALFFGHAVKLQPDNAYYLAEYLRVLDIADPVAATRRAEEILRAATNYSPEVVARAARIQFQATRAYPEPRANEVYQRIIPVLRTTLTRFEKENADDVDSSFYLMAITLLGFSHEFLGEAQPALDYYSRGLQLQPRNDALLVARGMLLYGTSPRASSDFELAIRYGSPVVWPYFFLAHDNLVNGRFEQCRKLCERAFAMPASAAVRSELSEWLGICESELGFPADVIRVAFEESIRLDPSNERARRNLDAFEAAVRMKAKKWEMRSRAAVREASLAERRFSMAA